MAAMLAPGGSGGGLWKRASQPVPGGALPEPADTSSGHVAGDWLVLRPRKPTGRRTADASSLVK